MSPFRSRVAALTSALLSAAGAFAQSITDAFTFQGELRQSGSPATGAFDLEFRLFDALAAGAQVGPAVCLDNHAVTGGRFNAALDFGPVFNGAQRFLEIRVRQDTGLTCANPSGYTLLTPRQLLTAAPYASFALMSAAAGTAGDALALAGQPGAFYTNASNLAAGTIPDARLSANVPRIASVNQFTQDNVFLANVGIGTTPSGDRLEVAGVIRTTGGVRFGDGSLQMTAARPPLSAFIVGTDPGDAYPDIQSAVNAASAAGGGLVIVKPGTYVGNVSISSSGVHLAGALRTDYTRDVVLSGSLAVTASGRVGLVGLDIVSITGPAVTFSATAYTEALISHCNITATNGNCVSINLPGVGPQGTKSRVTIRSSILTLEPGTVQTGMAMSAGMCEWIHTRVRVPAGAIAASCAASSELRCNDGDVSGRVELAGSSKCDMADCRVEVSSGDALRATDGSLLQCNGCTWRGRWFCTGDALCMMRGSTLAVNSGECLASDMTSDVDFSSCTLNGPTTCSGMSTAKFQGCTFTVSSGSALTCSGSASVNVRESDLNRTLSAGGSSRVVLRGSRCGDGTLPSLGCTNAAEVDCDGCDLNGSCTVADTAMLICRDSTVRAGAAACVSGTGTATCELDGCALDSSGSVAVSAPAAVTLRVGRLTFTNTATSIPATALALAAHDPVDSVRILDLNVTNADLAEASVSSAKVQDATISNADLASDPASLQRVSGGAFSVSGGDLTVAPGFDLRLSSGGAFVFPDNSVQTTAARPALSQFIVGPDQGDAYSTIQAAVNAAQAAGAAAVILIKPGEYTENVTVTGADITLAGVGAGAPQLPRLSGRLTIQPGPNAAGTSTVKVWCVNVKAADGDAVTVAGTQHVSVTISRSNIEATLGRALVCTNTGTGPQSQPSRVRFENGAITTQSNVFAVWVTVGFFECVDSEVRGGLGVHLEGSSRARLSNLIMGAPGTLCLEATQNSEVRCNASDLLGRVRCADSAVCAFDFCRFADTSAQCMAASGSARVGCDGCDFAGSCTAVGTCRVSYRGCTWSSTGVNVTCSDSVDQDCDGGDFAGSCTAGGTSRASFRGCEWSSTATCLTLDNDCDADCDDCDFAGSVSAGMTCAPSFKSCRFTSTGTCLTVSGDADADCDDCDFAGTVALSGTCAMACDGCRYALATGTALSCADSAELDCDDCDFATTVSLADSSVAVCRGTEASCNMVPCVTLTGISSLTISHSVLDTTGPDAIIAPPTATVRVADLVRVNFTAAIPAHTTFLPVLDPVDGPRIVDLSVALADLATSSVNSSKILDAAVANADLALDPASLARVAGGVLGIAAGDLALGSGTDVRLAPAGTIVFGDNSVQATAARPALSAFVVGPDTGDAYADIQSAVNAAGAAGGGIVVVKRGTYAGNVSITAPNVHVVAVAAARTRSTKVTGTVTVNLAAPGRVTWQGIDSDGGLSFLGTNLTHGVLGWATFPTCYVNLPATGPQGEKSSVGVHDCEATGAAPPTPTIDLIAGRTLAIRFRISAAAGGVAVSCAGTSDLDCDDCDLNGRLVCAASARCELADSRVTVASGDCVTLLDSSTFKGKRCAFEGGRFTCGDSGGLSVHDCLHFNPAGQSLAAGGTVVLRCDDSKFVGTVSFSGDCVADLQGCDLDAGAGGLALDCDDTCDVEARDCDIDGLTDCDDDCSVGLSSCDLAVASGPVVTCATTADLDCDDCDIAGRSVVTNSASLTCRASRVISGPELCFEGFDNATFKLIDLVLDSTASAAVSAPPTVTLQWGKLTFTNTATAIPQGLTFTVFDPVTGLRIVDQTVLAADLAPDSVTTSKVVDATITTAKLAAAAVTGDKIGSMSATPGQVLKWSGATWAPAFDNDTTYSAGSGLALAGATFSVANAGVTGAMLAPASVGNVHVSAGAVGTSGLADLAVTSLKLADLSVATGKLTDSAVTSTKVADDAIGPMKIADQAVGTIKIANLAVTTPKLADLAVWTAKLADFGVTTPKLADNAATSAKIASDAGSLAKVSAGLMASVGSKIAIGNPPPTSPVAAVELAVTDAAAPGLRVFYDSLITPMQFPVFSAESSNSMLETVQIKADFLNNPRGAVSASTTSVQPTAAAVHGELGGIGAAIRGLNTNPAGFAVFAVGNMGATGGKPFCIDHPDDPANKFLLHYASEAPEPQNFYNGIATLGPRGEAWVELPAYFAKINKDPRYQLTCLGAFAPVYVAGEIDPDAPISRFLIAGGTPGLRVSWEVKAVRNDAWFRTHGAPVEVEKPAAIRGRYLHPELHAQPRERGVYFREDAPAARLTDRSNAGAGR